MIITIMLKLAKITILIVLDQMWSDLIYVRDVRTETSLPPTRRTGGRSLILNVIIAIKCRFKIILIIPGRPCHDIDGRHEKSCFGLSLLLLRQSQEDHLRVAETSWWVWWSKWSWWLWHKEGECDDNNLEYSWSSSLILRCLFSIVFSALMSSSLTFIVRKMIIKQFIQHFCHFLCGPRPWVAVPVSLSALPTGIWWWSE